MSKLISATKVCRHGNITRSFADTPAVAPWHAGRWERSHLRATLLAHEVCGIKRAHQISMAAPSNWDLQTCGHPQDRWSEHVSVCKRLYEHLHNPACNLAWQTWPMQTSRNHRASVSAVDGLPKGPQRYGRDWGEQVPQMTSKIAFCDLYLPY